MLALFMAMICTPVPGAPLPNGADTMVREFATCTGRLSAMMGNPDIIAGLTPQQLRDDRDSFSDLLAASLPGRSDMALSRQALTWRVQARAAHHSLLQIAAYSPDPRRARIARATLRAQITACRAMLLQ